MSSLTQELMAEVIAACTTEVVSTMLGMEAAPQPPAPEGSIPTPNDSVIALVGIAGDWSGTGTLSCSADLACKLSGGLLSTEFTAIDDEVLDAVGEIANMVIGNIKNRLEGVAGPLALSIPTVIYGRNFVTRSMSKRQSVLVPFAIDLAMLQVHLCIEPSDSRVRLARAVDRLATCRR